MKFESHTYLLTAAVGFPIVSVLWFAARKRVQHSWRWRAALSLLLAAIVAPTIFRLLGEASVLPAVVLIPNFVAELLAGGIDLWWGLLYLALPIIAVATIIFLVWAGLRVRRYTDETRAA